jgi:hypothetical protein
MPNTNPDIVRERINQLILNSGLNYRVISLMMGKSEAYMQQFIKLRSPLRLKEIDRKKLAQILHVPEQELTDIPLSSQPAGEGSVLNPETLTLIITEIETWLDRENKEITPANKARLITLIYKKITQLSDDQKTGKIKDLIDTWDSLQDVM